MSRDLNEGNYVALRMGEEIIPGRWQCAWCVLPTVRRLVCLEPGEQGEREGDEAIGAAETGTPGENLGFSCKSDWKPYRIGQGRDMNRPFYSTLPFLQHPISVLIRAVISPLLPEYLPWLLPSFACLHDCYLVEVIILHG